MSSLNHAELAPVALFVFKRPQLTASLFDRVRAAKPRRLLVIADGPRPGCAEDAELCEATRKIVSSPDWPCELSTNFSEINLGCRRRLSTGLDWVFDQCAEAIVLEDDCLPCPSFFSLTTALLSHYREDARIMHISGDNFQDGVRRGAGSYYFSRYTHSWGWATWKRAWQYYDADLSLWPTARQEGWLASILDDPDEADYWTRIFERLYRGEIDTWDYQWLFACWIQNGLSILPNENLVTNVGVGPDALHFKEGSSTHGIATRELGECAHPPAVFRDKKADRYTFVNHIHEPPPRRSRQLLRKIKARLTMRKCHA